MPANIPVLDAVSLDQASTLPSEIEGSLLPDPPVERQVENNSVAAQMAIVSASTAEGEEVEAAYKAAQGNIARFGLSDSVQDFEANLTKVQKEASLRALDTALVSGDKEEALSIVKSLGLKEELEDTFVASITNTLDPVKDEQVSSRLYVENRLGELAEQFSDRAGFSDYGGDIINDIFIPFHDIGLFNEILSDVGLQEVGVVEGRVSIDANKVRDLVSLMGQLPQAEVDILLDKMVASAKSNSGLFASNYNEIARFFSMLRAASREDIETLQAFGGLDAVTYPVGLIKGVTSLMGKGATVVAGKALANDTIAATILGKDIVDGTKITGFSQDQLMGALLKQMDQYETLDGVALSGLSNEVQEAVIKLRTSRDVQELIATRGATLSPSDIANAVEEATTTLKNGQNKSVKSVVTLEGTDDLQGVFEVTHVTSKGQPFRTERSAREAIKRKGLDPKQATLEQVDGGYVVKARETIDWTSANVGALKTDVESAILRALPNFFKSNLTSLDPSVVMTRAIGVRMEAKAAKHFKNLYRDATSGLTGKQLKDVYNFIDEMDSFSKTGASTGKMADEYTARIRLGDDTKKVAAYYKLMDLRKVAHYMHDQHIVRSLRFRGLREVKLQGMDSFFGKQVDDLTSLGDNVKLYDPANKVTLTSKQVRSLIEKGEDLKVYRANGKEKVGEDIIDLYVSEGHLAKDTRILTALNYRPGEYARFYKDQAFVIEASTGRAVRTATTEGSAKKFASEQNAILEAVRKSRDRHYSRGVRRPETMMNNILKDIAAKGLDDTFDTTQDIVEGVVKGQIDDSVEYSTKLDREFKARNNVDDYVDKEFEVFRAQGRALTGERGTHLRNIHNAESRTFGVGDSLIREQEMVARAVGFGNHKEVLVTQFLKTFPKVGDDTMTPLQRVLYGEIPTENRQIAKYAERLRNHIKTQLNIPTETMLRQQAVLREFSERMEGSWVTKLPGGSKLPQTLLEWRTADSGGFIRGMVFNAYLGMFNLAQLMVQAQAGAMVAAMHPIHGIKAFASYPAIRMALVADSVGNTAAFNKIFEKASSILGKETFGFKTAAELKETIALARKTGVLDDILSSATFHNKEGIINAESALARYTDGLGKAFQSGVHDTLALGRVPFQEGEAFGRIMALDVARRMLKDTHPHIDVLSREGMEWIIGQHERLTFGMSRANIMQMQRGIFAVPFQFAHYQWKFAEAMLSKSVKPLTTRIDEAGNLLRKEVVGGKVTWVEHNPLDIPYQGFSKGEKFRVAAFSLGMYGTAAFPGLDWMAEQVWGESLNELDREQQIALKEGSIAWLLSSIDEESEFGYGSRVAPALYFEQLWRTITEDGTPVEFVMGPAGGIVNNTLGGISEIYKMFKEPELNMDRFNDTLVRTLSGLTSTSNTLYKYFALASMDQYVRSKKGTPLYEITPVEQVGTLFGLKPFKEYETWDLQNKKLDMQELRNFYATSLQRIMLDEQKAYKDTNMEEVESLRQSRAMLLDTVREIYGYNDMIKVSESAMRKAGKDPLHKTLYKENVDRIIYQNEMRAE